MKKIFLLVLLGFVTLQVFAQGFDTIKISKDVEVVKISKNAYVHISYMKMESYGRVPANGMILVHGSEAFLFDTPWTDSLTAVLLHWIQDTMKLTITGCVVNDWHWDSMGGLKTLHDLGIPTYGNEMTREITQQKGLPLPKNVFKDSLTIMFGTSEILCYYFGPAHTLDNIVVWIPSEKILFADCMIKEVDAKDLGFTGDGDVHAYQRTVNKVKEKFKNAKYVIPGHGDVGGTDLIEHTLELAKKK